MVNYHFIYLNQSKQLMLAVKYSNFLLCTLYNSQQSYFAYFHQKKLQYLTNYIIILIIYNNNLVIKITE